MTASSATITVLMAVHNGLRHLRAATQSVLAQSFADFEFLIIDDASDEATRRYLKGLSDRRVRLLRNDRNLGLTASLNRGLGNCQSQFIARMDSDDLCESDRFAEQIAFLQQNLHLAGCGTWTTDIDDDDAVVGSFSVPGHPNYVRWTQSWRSVVIHPSVLLRREALDAVGGYDERFRYAQDYELFTRLVVHGHQLAILEKPLLRYRRGSASITSTRTFEQRPAAGRIRKVYLEHLLGRPISEDAATAYHSTMSLGPLPVSPQLAEGLEMARAVWRSVEATAAPAGRDIVRRELTSRLIARADEALGHRPHDAAAIARALAHIPGRRTAAARLWLRAVRCTLGRRRRGLPVGGGSDEKAGAT